ncbi:glycoside hydrolase family 43 protein [Streptomyces sp. HC44]|uniref:Glycoside hydrolase family 43 protein n=1 Tax=Streptomyces scabichelini TaxID=2711217 RepID=A0A6G4V900_9ACTN|nr:glycoside hydrolase family 43 protein [Streptomyces scabichelini]NGO10294.1 glycoside hydrolase family 43 protein [Streptomyces scabichelini]
MTAGHLRNPVLPGFHPDPSIVRVGADYFIATSTFEWYPGVPVHRSKDLVHWEPAGHILDRPDLLDLRGVPDSAGVWAPSLSYRDGQFWLVYTIVRTIGQPYKDLDNYLITAPSIEGPWSEPVFLNSSGFDPSFFHDEDGRSWLLNIQWDPREGHPSFAGILLQEYDAAKRALIGQPRTILQHDELIEGPNVYFRDGWYYLMLAEGGTGWNHGILMARSRELTGPYELDPLGSLLTTRDTPDWPLQKAGHGELVETPEGEWFLAHLASRPVRTPEGPRCVLGRETCLQRVTWTDDGWLRLADGGRRPSLEVLAPTGVEPGQPGPAAGPPARDDFNSPSLDGHWSTLRAPATSEWLTLGERPGHLRLRGRQSPHSLFDQSLLARRLTSVRCEVTTVVDFRPSHFSQRAGLICWYDTSTHYYLRLTHTEGRGRVLGVVLSDDGAYRELPESELGVDDWPLVHLRARFDSAELRFFASPDGTDWQAVGPALDASKLSDDYGNRLRFTGAFVGISAQDLGGTRAPADFDWFEVRDLDDGDGGQE